MKSFLTPIPALIRQACRRIEHRMEDDAMLGIYARTFMIATRTDAGQPLDAAPGTLVRLFERLRGLARGRPSRAESR
ncbi:MAG: hypothetical protein KDJ78_15245 [Rhodobacteraceae bacterium]|uniref:hypothetical protein n=1 Tax=Amaricoccus sp. TaxID=1872485 RepID=UPI001E0957EF|nr:hypothetical protein [Amaricoccus sp.]MCB1375507.1 hypothetical protein [Paracoccaceae bacterium]